MVRRSAASPFVGGMHVFPGGAVDDADRGALASDAVAGADDEWRPWVAAALRETAEEASVWITDEPFLPRNRPRGEEVYRTLAESGLAFAAHRVGYLSSWVTPPGHPRRYDTRFLVAAAPAGTPAEADGSEVTEAVWTRPSDALERRDWRMVLPTVHHLELLASFPTPAEAVSEGLARLQGLDAPVDGAR